MRWLEALGMTGRQADVSAALRLASPLQVEDPGLASLVWADIVPADVRDELPMTRSAAMAVAPVAAARHLVCPAIARMDLRDYPDGSNTPSPVQPTWITRTDSDVSAYHRMLWTVDDILFHGWSLWEAERGSEGQVLRVTRVPMDQWQVTDGIVERMDRTGLFRPMRADQAVLIPGPHEGILHFGATTIRQAADLLASASRAARNPAAQVDLHYTGDTQLTQDEIQELVDWWVKARRGDNGGVAFTSKHVEAKDMTAHDGHLMIEGRNAAAVDVARIIGVRAANIDASNAGASLTYETTETRGGELVTFGLSAYMTAITARLSLSDITPGGRVVRFEDEDRITPTPTNTNRTTTDNRVPEDNA